MKSFARGFAVPVLAVVASLALGACATTRRSHPGFEDLRQVVQVLSAVVGGKNVFIPSTIVIADNGPRRISIYNSTDTIHGFAIRGLGVQVELPPNQETEVELPAVEANHIYEIYCHLHGAHRTGALVVVRGRR
jgi:heme/copper-type cytochrome/quinol oxidase subunit 2